MRACLIGCALFLVSLTGCPPHGPFSLRQEAIGHFQAAIKTSRINEVLSEGAAPPAPEKLELALAQAGKALAIDPLFFPPHLLVIQLLALLNRPVECEEAMMYLLELFPAHESVREQIVLLEMQEFDNPEKASLILNEGIRRNPGYPGYYLLRGEIAAETGGTVDEIMANVEILMDAPQVLTDVPQILAAKAWVRVLGLCAAASRQEMSARAAAPLLSLADRAPDLLDQAVALSISLGLEEDSKELFLFAAHLPEAGFRLRLAAARLMVRMGDRPAAAGIVDAMSSAAGGSEDSGDITALEGHLAWLDGNGEEALRLFRQALDIDPISVDALEGLWLLYERTALVDVDEMRRRLESASEATRNPLLGRFLRERARSLQK